MISREQQRANRAEQACEALRHENETLRRDNSQYRAETSQYANPHLNRTDVHLANNAQFNMAQQQQQQQQPIQSPTAMSGYTTDRYAPPAQHLPPLRLNGNSESMNGIQYHDSTRVNAPQRY